VEQLSATSEVLKLISSAPGDLQAVFAAILANAVRICEAKFGMLMLHRQSEGSFDARVWLVPRLPWLTRCCKSHLSRSVECLLTA